MVEEIGHPLPFDGGGEEENRNPLMGEGCGGDKNTKNESMSFIYSL